MTDSAIASATYVVPGALAWQPHHNDALNRLEQLAQITVIDRTTTSAPAAPAQGAAYIVASAATGDWSTRVDQVAAYYSGWVYLDPREGWKAYDQDANRGLIFDGSVWQIDRTGLFKTTAYTAGTTWTKDAATLAVRVRLVAGGGGGGKGTAAAKTAGGGGAGEYAEGYFDSGVGASETVTIGAGGAGSTGANGGNGGTTSFGSLITALGGVASGDDLTVGALGGSGGTGGDFHAAGGNGGGGQNSDDGSGNGGASFFGSGGACGPIGGNAGQAGVPYGSGGGGGSNHNGGAGAGGWMIVEEYK